MDKKRYGKKVNLSNEETANAPVEQAGTAPTSVPETPTPSDMATNARHRLYTYAKRIVAAVGIPLLLGFVVQIVYETNHWENGPGTYLERIKDVWLDAWERAGRFVTYLSSYLEWIKWQAILDAADHYFGPMLEMSLFVLRFIKGYLLATYEYDHRLSIFVGTLLPLLLVGWLLYRYTRFYSRVKAAWQWVCGICDSESLNPRVCFSVAMCGVAMFVAIYFYFWYSETLFSMNTEQYPGYFAKKHK